MDAIRKQLPILRTVALGLLVAGAAAGLARAATDGQRFKDWAVKCHSPEEEGPHCVLFQNLTRKEGDAEQPLMSTVVGEFGKDVGLAALFTVPLGVFLPAGATLRVDGHDETKRLDYQFCMRSGCRAVLRLDDRWLALFKAGAKATITVEDALHQGVALPLSLHGFSSGLEQVAAP